MALPQLEGPRRQDPEPEVLTRIRARIHSATPKGPPDTGPVALELFLETLARVAMAIARRDAGRTDRGP